MTRSKNHTGLVLPSLIWLGVLAAALCGAYFRGLGLGPLWPLAGVAALPALLTLCLSPWLRAEWAQIIVMFAWAALAVLACTAYGFVPMALMFLCVPAIAMLFLKEKVIEGLIISAVIAALVYFAGRQGHIPDTPLSDVQRFWGQQTGIMGTIALVIGTMFAGAQSRIAAPVIGAAESEDDWDQGLVGGLLDFDKDGALVSANKTATRLLGLDDVRGPINLGNVLSADSAAQGHFDAQASLMAQSRVSQSQRMAVTVGEVINHVDLHLSPLPAGKSRLHIIDRGDEEAKLDALRFAQNRARRDSDDKTLFFAGVSHELRTPLNAIIGFSDMMRSRLFGPLPGKYAEYADLIHDSGQHMLDLLGDVLDLSKVGAGKYELSLDNFDVADVVRSSVKMIRPAADAADVKIHIDLPENDPLLIQADRRAVRQILLNILSNAVKFSDKGSSIYVDAKTVGTDMLMTVKDEGAGMSAEEIERIGEPYVQGTQGSLTTERGSGLGLSLVQSLTDLHRGEMTIDSIIDAGTTVTVKLPITATY